MKKENKLKIFYLVLLAIALGIIDMAMANAYFYNITYACNDNICVKDETATWSVAISNNGHSDVEYISIEFLSITNDTPFASLKIPFYPLSSNRGKLILVRPNEKVTVNLTGKLPKANYSQPFIYYPCFTTAITDSYIIAQDNKYESRQCYNKNETMQIIECISNDNCNKDEFCSFNRCLKLNCKSCQYIKNHACVDYECCSSEQCKPDGMCKNNTCKELDCNFNEYVFNHTCLFLNCGFDESIINQTCRKLNCNDYEFTFNHTCKNLNCSENEFVQNHTCKLLECNVDEYAKNHVCSLLECKYNETFFNHTCKPLNCYFFQDVINHSCINNKYVIFKSFIEVVIVIVIIIFFVIDFKKYEKKRKENKEDIKMNANI